MMKSSFVYACKSTTARETGIICSFRNSSASRVLQRVLVTSRAAPRRGLQGGQTMWQFFPSHISMSAKLVLRPLAAGFVSISM